ncbi:protein translocase subunit SecF [Aliifodinibius sp. S!AR15-10]|uniref:protein translocase subunit SecF n=1 Tax=Aliifodinibius sp. S!AR15-10 TaxID=2950437 RepID=UPI0028543950|nr:protein translocase subunit SecF [Aliifodinibius sp. S!AR15-10]MDR8393629.1 protein translocase subunit SecF [Aliifodinibius sp. S!AR15-10]
MRFFANANFDFIGKRVLGYTLSGILLTASLAAIFVRGLQYGIDFRGGSELVVAFGEPVSVIDARTVLSQALGSEPQARLFGSSGELQIRTTDTEVNLLTEQVTRALTAAFPGNSVQVVKTDVIGPVFAQDMQEAAKMATLFSLLVISIYIFIRFRTFIFAVSVLATLIHDMIIIIGLFTLLNGVLPFNMDIDQVLIGAFLTIIGYSLNDTIVVFDRIRENRLIHKEISWVEIVNRSINQTMSRTVVTSLTTFMVVAVLFLFGGAVLKGFSFALMIGIALGTYSTIFISCPMLVDMRKQKQAEMPRKKAEIRSKRVTVRGIEG